MRKHSVVLAILWSLQGCGGGDTTPAPTYTISGVVTGLAGVGLVLQNNGTNDLSPSSNGFFSFSSALHAGSTYNVSVKTQPVSPNQTCSVTNGIGSANNNITNVTVTCTTNQYSISGTVANLTGSALVIQNNDSDDLTISTNGNFTFPTTVQSGNSYTITVKAQPTGKPYQSCSITNGTGTIVSSAVSNILINCRNLVGKFLYVINRTSGNISAFKIDPLSGLLTTVSGSPFNAGTGVLAATPSPSGNFLYVALQGAGSGASLIGYYINNSSGELTPIAGTYPAGTSITVGRPIIHPSGNFLYINNFSEGKWFGYAINQLTGQLSAVPNSPYTLPSSTQGGEFDASGKFFWAPYGPSTSVPTIGITTFAVNSSTGELTAVSSMLPGISNTSAATQIGLSLHPSGKFLYDNVSSQGTSYLAALAINADTGVLSNIEAPHPTGILSGRAAIHSSGKYAYVVNRGGTPTTPGLGSVTMFSINTLTGGLTEMSGSPILTGGYNSSGPILRSGSNHLITFNTSSPSLSVFTIDSINGALTSLGSPLAFSATSPTVFAFDPSEKFAYLSDNVTNTITVYSVDQASATISTVTSYATGGSGSASAFTVGLQ